MGLMVSPWWSDHGPYVVPNVLIIDFLLYPRLTWSWTLCCTQDDQILCSPHVVPKAVLHGPYVLSKGFANCCTPRRSGQGSYVVPKVTWSLALCCTGTGWPDHRHYVVPKVTWSWSLSCTQGDLITDPMLYPWPDHGPYVVPNVIRSLSLCCTQRLTWSRALCGILGWPDHGPYSVPQDWPDHGPYVVSAERVVQVEPYAVVVLQAEVVLPHHHAVLYSLCITETYYQALCSLKGSTWVILLLEKNSV